MGAAIAPIAAAAISAGGGIYAQEQASKAQKNLQKDSQQFQEEQQDKAADLAKQQGPQQRASIASDMRDLKRRQLGNRGILSTVSSSNDGNILGG
jgi:Flp pilus assembly protein TadB